MQDKDNVCVETIATEQGSVIQDADGVKRENRGSTDLGKFKDVNALMQAYTALQAEFTRRSQRLKRYEKEEENQAREEADAQKRVAASVSVDASAQSEQGPSFTEEESIAVATADADGKKDADDGHAESVAKEVSTTEESAKDAAANVVGAAFEASVAEQQALSLYERVMANEEVRLKVIGDYLSSIGKNGAPLLVGGKGVMQTPPKRPTTISDAGKLALAYLKTQRAEK